MEFFYKKKQYYISWKIKIIYINECRETQGFQAIVKQFQATYQTISNIYKKNKATKMKLDKMHKAW